MTTARDMPTLSEYYGDYYGGQSSNAWYHEELASLQAEAEQRGISLRQVEDERRADAADARHAEQQRVQSILDDPDLVRRLKRYWNCGLTGRWYDDGRNPLDPPPAPPAPPASTRTGPPSSGRNVSPERLSSRPAGSAAENAFAAGLWRTRNHV